MTDESPSILDLISRFQLRRRATTSVFAAGMGLVSRGAVELRGLSHTAVEAWIRDGQSYLVRLRVSNGELVGTCSCAPDAQVICSHQVAAAHAVWIETNRPVPCQEPPTRPRTPIQRTSGDR